MNAEYLHQCTGYTVRMGGMGGMGGGEYLLLGIIVHIR